MLVFVIESGSSRNHIYAEGEKLILKNGDVQKEINCGEALAEFIHKAVSNVIFTVALILPNYGIITNKDKTLEIGLMSAENDETQVENALIASTRKNSRLETFGKVNYSRSLKISRSMNDKQNLVTFELEVRDTGEITLRVDDDKESIWSNMHDCKGFEVEYEGLPRFERWLYEATPTPHA